MSYDIKRNRTLTIESLGLEADKVRSAVSFMAYDHLIEAALVTMTEMQSAVHVRTPTQFIWSEEKNLPAVTYPLYDHVAEKRYHRALAPYLIGRQVRLVKPVDVFPTGIFEVGLTGVVSFEGEDGFFTISLDQHRPELDEWENELHFSTEGWEDADGNRIYSIEHFLSSVEFVDGDVVVREAGE